MGIEYMTKLYPKRKTSYHYCNPDKSDRPDWRGLVVPLAPGEIPLAGRVSSLSVMDPSDVEAYQYRLLDHTHLNVLCTNLQDREFCFDSSLAKQARDRLAESPWDQVYTKKQLAASLNLTLLGPIYIDPPLESELIVFSTEEPVGYVDGQRTTVHALWPKCTFRLNLADPTVAFHIYRAKDGKALQASLWLGTEQKIAETNEVGAIFMAAQPHQTWKETHSQRVEKHLSAHQQPGCLECSQFPNVLLVLAEPCKEPFILQQRFWEFFLDDDYQTLAPALE